MKLTEDNLYFRWFWRSLRDEQKTSYREMSINEQKDWYITYLESHYQPNKPEQNERA